jgi:hypothetical protein
MAVAVVPHQEQTATVCDIGLQTCVSTSQCKNVWSVFRATNQHYILYEIIKNASNTCAVLFEAYGGGHWKSQVSAVETTNIPTIQESLHVRITNEDTAHYFLLYQGYCSLWIHSIRQKNHSRLLHENIEVVMWSRKRPELWLSDCILHHASAPAHKALPVNQFLAQNQLLKWNTHMVSLIWFQMTCGCFQK